MPNLSIETAAAIRDRLPADAQLRDFALRRAAVENGTAAVDLERAIAALPERKLTGDERDDADLADLRVARDEAYQNGYPVTGDKLDTAVGTVERHLSDRNHAPDRRGPGPGAESAAIVADHAAASVLASIREARRELSSGGRRIAVADAAETGRRYTLENCPSVLPDGAILVVA